MLATLNIETFLHYPTVLYPLVVAASFVSLATAITRLRAFQQLFKENRISKYSRLSKLLKDHKQDSSFLELVISEEIFRIAYGASFSSTKRKVITRYVLDGILSFDILVRARTYIKVENNKIVVSISKPERFLYKGIHYTSLFMILSSMAGLVFMGLTSQFDVTLFASCIFLILMAMFYLYQNRELDAAHALERELKKL